jgi:hypothetical protein
MSRQLLASNPSSKHSSQYDWHFKCLGISIEKLGTKRHLNTLFSLLSLLLVSGLSIGQSVQDFGTGTTSFSSSNTISTTYLPNPSTGTQMVRMSNGGGGGFVLQNPSALGTSGSSLRATASTSASVVKVAPIVNNTAGKVAYARFKVMFGNASGGNTATSGIWQMFLGNGASFSDANDFTSNQTNVGLRFTYGASGAITMNYRNNANWVTTSLTSNPLYQSVYYDFEIFSNNKSSGTENYTYNGVAQTVAVGKFDLYVNGRILGNELNDGELASNSDIRSIMFTGISSTGNVANIFIDDVTLQNTLPATITRVTNPSAFDLSSGDYSFGTWANTNSVGTTPSNMKFHWSNVNQQNPSLAQSNATQDYVWGYNYSMNDSRINGLGANGIEFRQFNTGHSSTSSGNLGEAVVSLNTSDRQDVEVSWTAALQTDVAVAYRLRGQYRIGNSGAYTDLPGATAAIEFNSNGATAGTPVNFGPITLPAACNDQPEVQVKWVYYWGGSGTGLCDGIRLDDISVTSTCLAPVATAGTALSAICQGGTTAALGGSVSLPGTGGTWSTPAGGTFSPNATTLNATWTPPAGYSGTATLTLTTSGGSCGTDTDSKTIVVNATNTAGTASSSPTLCINTALTAITHTTTSATGIGTATGLPAGVTAAWAANTITISGTPTASGTFNYSIPLNGGCGTVNATGTITVTPANTAGTASSSPTLCINTALTNITRTTTGATGIGTATGLPAGVTAAWAANTITISGTPTASGTFNYSIPLTGGCGTVNATGTITVTPANTAGTASSNPTLCINTALTPITRVTSGATGIGTATGLPAGISASWFGNILTITGTPTASGTFNYSIPLTGGCGTVNATGTITVTPNKTVSSASSTPTLCANTALTNITHTTTGATGIGTATGLPAGVTAAWAANTITISGTPTAFGTFNYSIPLTGGCGTANATGTITVTQAASGTFAYAAYGFCNSVGTAQSISTSNFTGATGAFSSTAGLTINTSTGAITPSTSSANVYTVTYSAPAAGGCPAYSTTTSVTIDAAGTGTIAYTPTTFCESAVGAISPTITGAGGSGSSTWIVASPGGLNIDGAGVIIPIGSTPGIYTVTYNRSATGLCPAYSDDFNVTVTPNNTAGTPSSNPTICINTALTNITRTTTGATGIGTATGLPAGVTAAWAANTLTISGTPTASGTFNYSIPLTGGCGAVNATGTITVTPAKTAGAASSSPTLCINSALTTITHTTTGATNVANSGITGANGLPAGVYATWSSNTISINGTPTASGTFNYSIPLTGGCGSANATGTITVAPGNTAGTASSNPTLCINTALTAITRTTTGATGIGTATGLPAGVTAAWASNVLTISGTPTASGTFNYSIPLTGGCGVVNATGTITVTPANTAGTASSNPTVCINTAIANITRTTTGATGIGTATGLPAGITAAWAGNILTLSGTPTASGTFNYSIPLTGGCGTVSATGTITVTPNKTVSVASSSPTLCINTALTNITHTTTLATGIANSGTAGVNGLPAGVAATWSANTITISGTPTASGTFNYSIPLTGGCGTVNATGTITVNPVNTAGTPSSNPTVCINAAITPITRTTTGATGIGTATGLPAGITAAWAANTLTLSGTPTANGTFNYSIPLTGGCGSVNATGTITVTPTNTAGTPSSNPTVCINTAITNISRVTTGATGIGTPTGLPAGLTASFGTNTITISGTPTASGTFNYSIPLTGGCGTVNATGTITVTPINTAGSPSSNPTLCEDSPLTAITIATTRATGIGTATGLPAGVTASWASNVITISGTPTIPGTFNYSIPLTGGCGSVNATGTITVNPAPTVNVGAGLAAICQGGTSAALGGSVTLPATGGTWSSASGGTFSPNANTLNATWTPPAAFNGIATLTLTSSGGTCGTANGSKNITVNALPANAGAITGTAAVCQGQSGVVYQIAALANATSYTWSYSGTGFTASGTTASIFGSFSASATSGILTVRGVNTCGNGVASANYAITVNSAPAAAGAITGSPSLCQGQTGVAFSVAPIAGATSYLWSYTGTGFTPSGTTASITANFSASATAGVLTVRGVNSCGNGVASANYNISVAQLPGTPGTILGPSTVCKGQSGFTFTIPAIANATSYNWVYTGTGITFSGNTATVTATISNTATSGVIRVRGVSACLNGAFSADFPVTVINAPVVSITSNYCGNPGFVILTASSGFTNYLWSTGATTSFVNADIAGQYSVTVANSAGCTATASVGVATELVTNGDFDAGNTGFSTNYTYVTDGAGATEMYPEGTYAVVPNANTVHNMFWGTGHTPSGGNYMVVNGSPALGQDVWSQNNITVQPNTTYYFSAWGLSVVNGNNAVLRFSINGSQVGTIAYLPNGYTSTAGPFNWVRFYGSWNSGFATEADLSIINLNTILGGNDFGLDDISFGTLSPVALTVSPSTILGTTVCQGNELVLNANAVGGASPFTYQWSGPNGFTSTVMNPTVTASAAAVNAGTYTLTVTDGFGCSASSNVVVTISALPLDKTPVATTATVCVNGNSSITIASSQTGVSYQLRNDADESPVGDPVAGTGGTISFPVDNLSATTTYNVLATGALTQCPAEMSTTVTITVATTPVLAITNQAVCSGTVNLTAAAVTAGSTGSGTLSYWTNSTATTALATPTSVATSGVYYIRSIVGSCFDIEPVTVSISTTPITGFSYPGTPYCSTELDPAATMNASAVAGVFSCTNAGLVFSNTSTGAIDLSASTPGTYTVRNTVSPTGGCPSVNSTSSVVITGAPLTDFSYDAGNDFCQVYSAVNPSPVFGPGAAAGTFASTFGLNFVSTSTGVVNLASSTPGNYAIWNTRPAVGGCAAESDTVFIDINPYVFAGSVNTSVSDDIVCLGETIDLFSQTSAYSSVLLRERFNGTINNWVRANSSVGGTVANAAWTLRPNDYNYNSNNYRSNDNTQFYMSNSQAQAGTTTLTTLRSPVMNTVGYTNLSLDFFHYFNAGSVDTAQVQVSLNNTTWTTVATYTTNQGNRTAFTNPVINLNAYIGQPIFYVRFRYRATDDRYWAIDNVSLTGNCNKYFYDWASAPAGFSSTSANPVDVAPPQNSFYVVDATNTFGCSNPSSPLPVTVNALPILTSSLTPPAVCGNEVFTYVPASTPSSALISWTRPAATGITNAAITAAQSGNPSETLENLTNSDKNVIYNFSLDNNGCSQVVPVTVAVKPIPVIDLGANLSVCNGSPAQLNTTITNGLNVDNYSWSPSTGLSNTTISDPTAVVTTASQSYTVTVQTTNGCSNTSSSISVSNQGFGGTAGLWLGTINSNWDDCRNWADGKIPTNTTNVTIDGNALNDIQITGSQQCNNLLFLSNNNTTRAITLLANSTLTASGNVAVTKSNGTGTITLRVMNNATLTCNNLSISGTVSGAGNAIVQKDMVNTTINVNGSLSIDPGAQLDMNDGNNGTSEGTMSIKGNFVNNGNAADFNVGNVEVIFNGNALQTITCPTTQDFGSITLDNSSVAGVKLNNNISVSRAMQFINGLLDLNQRTLTLGSSTANAAITGSGNNSYILAWDGSDNGTVIQQVNNLGFNYLFPIGDLNEYTPFTVNLSSATLSNATLTAKLYGTVNPNIIGSTNYLGRYWSIEPSGITNPLYSVQYNYAAVDIFGSEAFLFPAKYNSGGWQSCIESASNAMIGNGSINAGSNTLTWSGITTFSEFTAIGNGSPLPIELLDFTAEPTSKVVNLKWITASETNNSHFTVERSSDGVVFKPVLEKPGAGNSNSVRSYSDVDENPLEGVSYYRLKQTDFNGEFTYSEWVVVNFIGDQKISLETVFADRSTGNVFFRCNNPENQNININIFDASGKMIHSSSQFSSASNWSGSVNMGSLSKGSYIVRLSIAGQMLHGKFVY